jgi:flavin-dependent dehydrogenase
VAPNVLLVGDAAGYFDPFTGQGIHQALRSAELAAPRIAELLERPDDDDPLHRYAQSLRREIRPVRLFQRIVEKVMDGERSRLVAVRGLQALPWYADRVVRVAGDAAPVRTLAMLDLGMSRGLEVNG